MKEPTPQRRLLVDMAMIFRKEIKKAKSFKEQVALEALYKSFVKRIRTKR